MKRDHPAAEPPELAVPSPGPGNDLAPLRRIGVPAALYFAAQVLAFHVPGTFGWVTAVWPAAGIALASLLLSPRVLWPTLLGGLFAAGLAANLTTTRPTGVCVGFMVANLVETAASAWLITHLCGNKVTFARIREVSSLALAAFGVNAIGSMLGAAVASLAMGARFWTFFGTWWVADGLGLLLVTPLIVTWADAWWTRATPRRLRALETTCLFALGCTAAWFAFGPDAEGVFVEIRPYMLSVFVIWAAVRHGPGGTATLLAAVSVIAVGFTAAGVGPFPLGGSDAPLHLLAVQVFLGVLGTTGLLLAAAVAQQREGHALLHAVVEATPDAICVKDRWGRYLLINSAAARFVGKPAVEVLGKDDTFLFPRGEAESVMREDRISIASATPRTYEECVTSATGRPCVFLSTKGALRDETGEITGLFGISRDVTEIRQAEAALRESEAQYRSLFNGMTEGFALHDLVFDEQRRPCTYRFLSINPAFERLTGLKAADVVGKSQRDVLPDEDPFWFESYCGVALTGEPLHVEHYSPALQRWFEVYAYRPAPNQFAAVFDDITEHKQAEAELQKLAKLQSVGTLAGGIAHDFNNILTGLFGNIAFAKDELSPDHPAYALLDEASRSMSRAVRLTKQLLTFAKGGDPVKEDLCLAALVEEVAQFDLSGSAVRLQLRPAEALWLAKADKGQIQQVVSNLVINARQAMLQGGCLWISLDNVVLGATNAVGIPAGNYVQVTVRDEGSGIEPRHLDRIFDPYFTTKQTGSGLGLATVYSILARHGGHIGVTSELGVGTTFTFLLPASDVAASAVSVEAVAAPPPARPARILLMDDEPMIRSLASSMLERCGYTVATAAEGQTAIGMYRQAMADGTPFDAVIMDLTIPGGLGGKDAIHILRQLDPHVRAIVSSGYADDSVMSDPCAHGFKGTVAKPYTRKALCDTLRQVLASMDPSTSCTEGEPT